MPSKKKRRFKAHLPTMEQLRAEKRKFDHEADAPPWIELTVRLTPNQYRMLVTQARFNEVTNEAMASLYTIRGTDRQLDKIPDGQRDYLEGLGF